MSSDEDKPPAPPVRLTSNRATDRVDSVASVDMRPLPKGNQIAILIVAIIWYYESAALSFKFVSN